MQILVTGAKGFIGLNLGLWLKNSGHQVFEYDKDSAEEDLVNYIAKADFIVHLAGINRPLTKEEFYDGNANFTKKLVDLIKASGKNIPIIFSSSTQAVLDNDYGKSKKMAEDYLLSSGLNVYVYRFSNVFGWGCRPNYNSFVSTLFDAIANNHEYSIDDKNKIMHLVYVDDICVEFIRVINGYKKIEFNTVIDFESQDISLGNLEKFLFLIKNNPYCLPIYPSSIYYKLYYTFISYLPQLIRPLITHFDQRGSFTELLKDENEGQMSVNVSKPKITKGNHFHERKVEQYLTIVGTCRIELKNIKTNEYRKIIVSANHPTIVTIAAGWAHNITNIGDTDSVTLMWCNEFFDKENPDTYYFEVKQNG